MRLENGEGASLESMLRIARALGVLDSAGGRRSILYATDLGRLRSQEALPDRVRPPKRGANSRERARSPSFVAIGEENVLVGLLPPHRRHGSRVHELRYTTDRFLANPHAYALDPTLPLVTGTSADPAWTPRCSGRSRTAPPDRAGAR